MEWFKRLDPGKEGSNGLVLEACGKAVGSGPQEKGTMLWEVKTFIHDKGMWLVSGVHSQTLKNKNQTTTKPILFTSPLIQGICETTHE